jgi:hypothetical protein
MLYALRRKHRARNALTRFAQVSGPGGGAPCLYAEPGEKKIGTFKLLHAGLFVYHCAAAPVPVHVANGMYGLILVEPEEVCRASLRFGGGLHVLIVGQGLPKVDREFYVMQSEIYAEKPAPGTNVLEPSYSEGLLVRTSTQRLLLSFPRS